MSSTVARSSPLLLKSPTDGPSPPRQGALLRQGAIEEPGDEEDRKGGEEVYAEVLLRPGRHGPTKAPSLARVSTCNSSSLSGVGGRQDSYRWVVGVGLGSGPRGS